MPMVIRSVVLSAFFLCAGTSTIAYAQNQPADMQSLLKKITIESEKLEKQKKAFEHHYNQLMLQEKILKELQARVQAELGGEVAGEEVLKNARGAGVSEPSVQDSPQENAAPAETANNGKPEDQDTKPTQTVGTDKKPKDKDRPPQVAAIADEGGVLLSKGTLVLEPSLEYTRSSAVRVAIEGYTIIPALNIGAFSIDQIDRDTVTSALTARYGITNRLEIEARVPHVYRNDSTLNRPVGTGAGTDLLQEASGNGLGDIEVAGHYQINKGQNGWPFFVGNLRFKTRTGNDPFEINIDPNTGLQTELPTGSGFYALQPSITAIIPSDPVVLYSNVGYLYNMERNVGGNYGKIDPGDSISASFGMGVSMNERTSFSLGYSHDVVFKTTQNGNTIANSDTLQVGSLNLGYAYRLNDRVSLNLDIGAGLTDDASDADIIFRVPVSFDLLK